MCPRRLRRWCLFVVAILVAALALTVWNHLSRRPAANEPDQPPVAVVQPASATTSSSQAQAPLPEVADEPFNDTAPFQLRPFAVALRAGGFEWTAEDGRDLRVIRQLAHNDGEYQRLVEENQRVLRRQLVYRAETTAALIERNKLTGQPLRQFALPGLDGQLVSVEVTRADVSPGGLQGMFAGQVAGDPDSLVTLAFKGGREAFTVFAPAAGLFLHAEPREPGELIVKLIDPNVYAAGYCGNP